MESKDWVLKGWIADNRKQVELKRRVEITEHRVWEPGEMVGKESVPDRDFRVPSLIYW